MWGEGESFLQPRILIDAFSNLIFVIVLLCIFYVTTQSGRPRENFPGPVCSPPKIMRVFRHFFIDLDTGSTQTCRSIALLLLPNISILSWPH